MKTGCIQHPERERLIVIRQWQLDFCEGDKVAAALISFFEYWHNVKLDQLAQAKKKNKLGRKHGLENPYEESLLQYHSLEDLQEGIMGIGKLTKIKEARKKLKDLGVISEHKNPNKKYRFDQTIFYLFHPKICSDYILSRVVVSDYSVDKNDYSSDKNDSWVDENDYSVVENDRTITETTTKTTTKTTSERGSAHARTGTHPQKNSSSLKDSSIKKEEGCAGKQCLNIESVLLEKLKQYESENSGAIKKRVPRDVKLEDFYEYAVTCYMSSKIDNLTERQAQSKARTTSSRVIGNWVKKQIISGWIIEDLKPKNEKNGKSILERKQDFKQRAYEIYSGQRSI